jgi:hypothetical protein
LVIGSRKDVEYVSEVLLEGDSPPIARRRATDQMA